MGQYKLIQHAVLADRALLLQAGQLCDLRPNDDQQLQAGVFKPEVRPK
jgi:hypothetical protein